MCSHILLHLAEHSGLNLLLSLNISFCIQVGRSKNPSPYFECYPLQWTLPLPLLLVHYLCVPTECAWPINKHLKYLFTNCFWGCVYLYEHTRRQTFVHQRLCISFAQFCVAVKKMFFSFSCVYCVFIRLVSISYPTS